MSEQKAEDENEARERHIRKITDERLHPKQDIKLPILVYGMELSLKCMKCKDPVEMDSPWESVCHQANSTVGEAILDRIRIATFDHNAICIGVDVRIKGD